ncbi:MAG: amidohydrolase family protein [Bryobacterales bacterium]|nr:amidohydrolase family protein [Bryobacterales bacterium]
MNTRLRCAFLAVFLAACGAGPEPPLTTDTTVLENFTLLDGNGGPPVPGSAMVVSGGRIQWVGPQAQLNIPARAERMDLSGKYVMPGIINLHGHLGNTLGLTQDPKNFTRENLESQLTTLARFGVTTYVTMGSEQPLILELRDEQRREGRPRMTRVVTALRGFTGKEGYPTSAPGMKGVPYEVTSVQEVQTAVKELADKKADLVKIWVDDHLGKENKIALNLAKAIIDEAHRHGLKVAAHIFYLSDAKELVRAGLDALAHSVRDKPVDDEFIALMKEKGAWLAAATLTREASTFIFGTPQAMLDDPFFQKAVPADVLATLRTPELQKRVASGPDFKHGPEWLAMGKKNLKILFDAGVKTGFGTDSGPPMRFQGYWEHWEMEMMQDAGLKANDILTIATRNSAEFLGMSKDLGTLETGKWADLLILGRNPIEDIRNTRSIEMVWIAGRKVE